MSTRGFQSRVSDRIHIGLGAAASVDSVVIDWPLGGTQTLTNVKADQLLQVSEQEHLINKVSGEKKQTVFSPIQSPVPYTHVEQGFNDFKRQPLLLTMLTPCGPIMASADVDKDGRTDLFVGGTQGNPGKIFVQKPDGSFEASASSMFDPKFTDADAIFFDADGDQDQDLYVVSGGYNEYATDDKALQDRLYLNDGRGAFTLSTGTLPEMRVSKSCVAASDFDHDGDMDLFVGGRVIPGQYPLTPESFLLENKGGRFENATAGKAAKLARIGMVTDAEWIDANGDGWDDLIVAGEFMPLEVFSNQRGRGLDLETRKFFDHPLPGLWNRLMDYDFDGDGDKDIVAGNMGLNTQLKASPSEPLELVFKDFDKNGSIDPILTCYIQGKSYPFAGRDELLDQMYGMRSKFTSYASYAKATLRDIFSSSDLKDAAVLKATTLATTYLENAGGRFVAHPLPNRAQFAPVFAMTPLDYNNDGKMDMILAGNQSSIRIRMGVIDANFGQLYEGDGKGNFTYVPQPASGLSLTGDAKSLQMVKCQGESCLLVGINNVGVKAYKLTRQISLNE
jgi:hypothetical protein